MPDSKQRPCDACGADITALIYDINVQQRLITADGSLQDVGAPLDLKLCLRCACGLATHALPLAMQHRQQQLARASRQLRVVGSNPEPTGIKPAPPPSPPQPQET